ncbi:acrosomal protein SP-10 [Lepus europaeus]|uniref:acrosomal protein SP-10 n=1 Tax=Lepus europaeus TaxID=9983 RepID=UPI002B4A100A|nr:acrosomal protein SP-10 [Lepus europaeus]
MNKCILLMGLYLLGSARGASGQPDEPPGSMDHQSSIHQLSGEYFPLGNPSDAEALYETSGENTLIEHGSSEHGTSEHTSGDQPSGDQPSGEKSAAEKPSGEHTSTEQPSGEHAAGEHGSGEQAVTSGEHTSEEQAAASGEHGSGEQAATSAERGSGEQAATSGEHGSGEQSAASGEQSAASGEHVDCHTCAFMNDQGKCLRGEGVCTTQNSQQCMLKKIFEGGKLQFMVQGCENLCPSMNLFSHGTRMQITCCRNQSFCNKV